jgi:hypothetical protein
MQRTAEIELVAWQSTRLKKSNASTRLFAAAVVACICVSAMTASLLPLQASIITVFLFAGPHNWFELRYFLMRLPARFGKSRNFFLTAFAGIGFLTLAYIAMPVAYGFSLLSRTSWTTALAAWNTLLLLWIASLVWQRGKQKAGRDWSWAMSAAFGLIAVNWLAPEMFSLAVVYLHPLVALWFLDRHLRRTRPEWVRLYHRCLLLVLIVLVGMVWQLSRTSSLADDNGLFWRITQHSGSELLPSLSSRLLVSVHVFLEMLHYGVWIFALPLIVRAGSRSRSSSRLQTSPNRFWHISTIPLARHPRGFPKLTATALLAGLFVVAMLWLGFSMDYSITRDVYFTVAVAHVIAEAPFLLRMI